MIRAQRPAGPAVDTPPPGLQEPRLGAGRLTVALFALHMPMVRAVGPVGVVESLPAGPACTVTGAPPVVARLERDPTALVTHRRHDGHGTQRQGQSSPRQSGHRIRPPSPASQPDSSRRPREETGPVRPHPAHLGCQCQVQWTVSPSVCQPPARAISNAARTDGQARSGGSSSHGFSTYCLSILIQNCSCGFDGRFLFHRMPSRRRSSR